MACLPANAVVRVLVLLQPAHRWSRVATCIAETILRLLLRPAHHGGCLAGVVETCDSWDVRPFVTLTAIRALRSRPCCGYLVRGPDRSGLGEHLCAFDRVNDRRQKIVKGVIVSSLMFARVCCNPLRFHVLIFEQARVVSSRDNRLGCLAYFGGACSLQMYDEQWLDVVGIRLMLDAVINS